MTDAKEVQDKIVPNFVPGSEDDPRPNHGKECGDCMKCADPRKKPPAPWKPEDGIEALIQRREHMEKMMAERDLPGEKVEIPVRRGSVRAILMKPESTENAQVATDSLQSLPLLIDLHGGGFVQGAPEMCLGFGRFVTQKIGAAFLALEYGLAPEHPYPQGLEDVFDAIEYIRKNAAEFGIDPEAIGVSGHSAGGNLATAVALKAKAESAFNVRCVIVDYAPLDLATDAFDKDLPEGCIPPEVAQAFDELYRTAEQSREIYCSPVLATEDDLKGLPPHLVLAAEQDSLCDEALCYAGHLVNAGVETWAKKFAGVPHGFTMRGMGHHSSPDSPMGKAARRAHVMIDDFLNLHLME